MNAPARVWVTRARPAAEGTAERLRALGFEPLVDPVIAVRPIAAAVELTGVAALAFTSQNGVAAFAAQSAERELAVFTVGEATAEAARAAGFQRVQTAAGDVRTLAAMIGGRAAEIHGAVLCLSAREPAQDLAALLGRRGSRPAASTSMRRSTPIRPTPWRRWARSTWSWFIPPRPRGVCRSSWAPACDGRRPSPASPRTQPRRFSSSVSKRCALRRSLTSQHCLSC